MKVRVVIDRLVIEGAPALALNAPAFEEGLRSSLRSLPAGKARAGAIQSRTLRLQLPANARVGAVGMVIGSTIGRLISGTEIARGRR